MKIKTTEQLRELYGFPKGRAKDKVLSELEKHSKHFIEKSPFLVLATFDKAGNADTSPRGGAPGFVRCIDETTIAIPDAKGNNRIDSLVNIVETSHVGLLLLLPGVDETLRINGKGHITTDQEILGLFDQENRPPKSCIVVEIEEVFLHCAKAFMRSKLWAEESKINRKDFPTIGQMLKDQLNGTEEVESHEDMLKRYEKDL
ncbi:MAG: pyridoxamine 5'-phosphate oxidase family protein [Saprospiraceae bacterium]